MHLPSQHNLPLEPDALIGRADEIDLLVRALNEQHRPLLTLIGPGGVGKTRLAVAVADAARANFEDGAWFVDLTGVPATEPDLLWLEVAETLGLAEPTGGPASAVNALESALAQRRMLLVLDNVEHVIEAVLPIASLLERCPGLQVIATSREPLRLRREHTYVVGPLGLPDLERLDRAHAHEALAQVPAVALFLDRARAVDPAFDLDDDSARPVSELCIRMDGLPLAIELAAAGMRLVSPRGLLERITRQPRMLSSRLRDIPERHRTLWSTIAWSYDLLSEPERQMFRHVSVFSGACSPVAVQAVLPTPCSEMDVLDGLDGLSTKSLLRVERDPDGELCFRMLQTLREFAREQLREHGEDEAAGRRHARYFLEFAEQAEPRLQGAAQQTWLARVGREHDNLRAAIQFSVQQGEAESALRVSAALWRFWWLRGHLHEGSSWLAQALSLAVSGDVPDAARAKALAAAGKLARERGDPDQGEAFARESLALFRGQKDDAGVALALNTLGNIIGDRADYVGAQKLYAESLQLRVHLDDTDGTALALHNLSAVARADGRLDEAARLGAESLDLFTALDDRWGVGIGLANLARIALLRNDSAGADLLARESLQVRQSLGDRQGTVRCLEILGQVALARGDAERATRLLSAVDGLRDAMGQQRPLDEQSAYDSNLSRAREKLDRERFEAAARAGRAMTLEATVNYAISAPASVVRAAESGLSPREVEVANLIAEGLTNRQIAERLVISKWTADNHVASILRKLDLTTRAQVAGWVAARTVKDADRAAPPAPTRADS